MIGQISARCRSATSFEPDSVTEFGLKRVRDASNVGDALADDTDELAGWKVTVGVVDTRYGVSQPGADAERYRCACLHCTQGLAGRADVYHWGLDWERSATFNKSSVVSLHTKTRMWANAQRDGRPAEYRWRPLFNAAKFG